MGYVKGKLNKYNDLFVFLDFLKEKGGRIDFYLPFNDFSVSVCYDGKFFYLLSEEESKSPKFSLLKFLDEWFISGVQPYFVFFEGEPCEGGIPFSEEELNLILRDEALFKVKELPPSFLITDVRITELPSFLVAYWRNNKSLTREDLYNYGMTYTELVKLIEAKALEIEPFHQSELFPQTFRFLLISFIAASLVYLLLPFYLFNVRLFVGNLALNWGLTYRLLDKDEGQELPFKWGFFKFYYFKDKVVSPGLDGKLGTEDDIVIDLPKEGYIPVFTVPER